MPGQPLSLSWAQPASEQGLLTSSDTSTGAAAQPGS